MAMGYNPRKRAAGLAEGASGDNANRRREGSGRFLKSTPCDFCGKSCAAEHFTDDRACGGGDGPGFYLCGKATCERARAKMEREQGFPALKHHYVEQRRKNDAMNRGKTKAFLDGPRGTEIQLANLRRQQDIVARRLSEATEDYKIEMLQKKERDLQEQIDKLVFGGEQVPNASHSVHPTVVQYAVQEMFKGKSPAIAARNTAQRLSGGTNMFIDSTREIEIDPVELEEALWKNMADYTMKYPPKPGDERNVARGTLSYFNQWKWGKPPKTKLEDRLMEYMAQRGTVEHMPNHSAVHYVWLIDYRGVPMDTEGPYGPMSIDRASAFARIGAKEGDHDRVVSVGREIMSDGFEIVRRYRRGTGERIL